MAPSQASHQQETKARAGRVLAQLKRMYPEAKCSLSHNNPLELLVATILSAQCTDDRVNIVTRELFSKYRSVADFARSSHEELEKIIRPTGFFRNKAKSIRAMAQSLIERHDGNVPESMDELVSLAGVGRKTANVVLGNAFYQNIGVVVDTHVGRLARRLGFTKQTDPEKIEPDLMNLFPQKDWCLLAHLLIYHGRKICKAPIPACDQCSLQADCPRIGVAAKKKPAGKKKRTP